jgi:Domain of unknown function (DUF3472)/Domain of unknown function (DUF5077)
MKALLLLLSLFALQPARAALRVPAFTAYLDPTDGRARISERNGITGWTDPTQKILWFGQIKNPGRLDCAIAVRLPKGAETKFRLTVAGKSHEVAATGAADVPTNLDLGGFEVAAGYQRFMLEALNDAGKSAGAIDSLILDGPAAQDAHFNLKSRRNAASVHLFYPVDKEVNVAAFYCEVTAVEDPVATFYMACGWHRGYFGMQVNGPSERRIIFSVWDSGNEGVNRNKVDAADRVNLVGKGEGVYSGDFGNEGTGGHSHLEFNWKTGEKQRFVVTARPVDATHTIYAGYYFRPDQQQWMLISAWKAPKDGGWLRGLHSFSEDFSGDNGQLQRKARYGNQWIKTSDDQWQELTTSTFSHDPTGRADRLDRFMGVEDGQFFLSHGGFVDGFTRYGEKFTRPATGKPPELKLPELMINRESP